MYNIKWATLQVYLRADSSFAYGNLTIYRPKVDNCILLKSFNSTGGFFVEVMLVYPFLWYQSSANKYNLSLHNFYQFEN